MTVTADERAVDFGNAPANAGLPSTGSRTGQDALPGAMPSAAGAPPASGDALPLPAALSDAGDSDASDASLPALDGGMNADGGADASLPPAPEPGTAFSACSQATDCNAGLVCTSAVTAAAAISATATVGYCTAFCAWDGANSVCPQPDSGWVKASCQVATTLCELESCERSLCPNGMRCMDATTPIGQGQELHTFTCQP